MSTHTMTEPDRSTFLNRWQVLLREPLVHFLALGLLLFVLDQGCC